MSTAYLAFGSNVGDRLKNLQQAHAMLVQFGVKIIASSPIYETEPFCPHVEDRDQPWVLNMVSEVETDHSSQALLLLGKEVESRLGRREEGIVMKDGLRRYFPREIDVDLLIYEEEVIETDLIQVPHPRFHARLYDLKPFSELAPDLVHPVLEKTIAELFSECNDGSDYRFFVKSLYGEES